MKINDTAWIVRPRQASLGLGKLLVDDERWDSVEHGDAYTAGAHPNLAWTAENVLPSVALMAGAATGLLVAALGGGPGPAMAVPILAFGLGGLVLGQKLGRSLAARLAPRNFVRVCVQEGEVRPFNGVQWHADGRRPGTTEVRGDGRIEPELFSEIETKTGNPTLLQDIRDPRLAEIVRASRAPGDYEVRHGEDVIHQASLAGVADFHLTQNILSRQGEQTWTGTPYQSIKLGRVDRVGGVLTPAAGRVDAGLLSGRQLLVTLNAHGAYDVQNITAVFDADTGKLVPGTVRESFLHSDLPLIS